VEGSGGRSSLLTRTVRTSLGTVVHHAGLAVAGGARLVTVRTESLSAAISRPLSFCSLRSSSFCLRLCPSQGNGTYKSVKLTVKRLEDSALSYRGEERVQLLHRWLVGLKETQRATAATGEPQPVDDPNQAAALLVTISFC
jgi:hypothetical protein